MNIFSRKLQTKFDAQQDFPHGVDTHESTQPQVGIYIILDGLSEEEQVLAAEAHNCEIIKFKGSTKPRFF